MVTANFKFRLGRRIGRSLERPRLKGTLLGRLYDYAERSYHNIGSQLEHYGETELIARLAPMAPDQALVLDVGANRGQYARQWLDACGSARVISFEVDPNLQRHLKRETEPYGERWRLEPFGLSNKSGAVPLFKSERSDEVTSLTPISGLTRGEGLARVEDAAAYVSALCQQVFFMKIDTEGHELPILKSLIGGSSVRPDLIQFEFGHPQVYSRCFLGDFYDCLNSDYIIGKIYLGGVEFKEYNHSTDELFLMSNYLAVKKNRTDILSLVSYKH